MAAHENNGTVLPITFRRIFAPFHMSIL